MKVRYLILSCAALRDGTTRDRVKASVSRAAVVSAPVAFNHEPSEWGKDHTTTMDIHPPDKLRCGLTTVASRRTGQKSHLGTNELESDQWKRRGPANLLLRRPHALWMLVALLSLCFALLTWRLRAEIVTAEPPRKTNGYTDVVTWDNYTLWIHNQRVFLTQVRTITTYISNH